jgi:hypothetical protein
VDLRQRDVLREVEMFVGMQVLNIDKAEGSNSPQHNMQVRLSGLLG